MRGGLPAGTIIMLASHSVCNACGGGCDPREKAHITRLPGYTGTPGKGCGIEFTHLSMPYRGAQEVARAMNLEFIELPEDW
jgi:hypothetical protein